MTRAIFDPAIFDPAIFDSHPTRAIFDPAIFDPRIFDTGTVAPTGGALPRGAFTLTYPTDDEDAVAVIAAIAAALAGPI